MADRGYCEEIVYIESEDGYQLEGLVIRPASSPARSSVVLWVHGHTGKFYERHNVLAGREIARQGFVFVSGNNRGHDFGTTLRVTGSERKLLAGGGWERLAESPLDVGPWIDHAAGLAGGEGKVVLVGHSLGTLKVTYYQALRQDPRVAGVVLASPPLGVRRRDPELTATAEVLVAAGRARDLLPWGVSPAGAGTVSAETYLERYRPDMDIFGADSADSSLARVRCPLLAIYGTDEAWVGSPADFATIRARATAAPRVDTLVVEGANHIYTGCEATVGAGIAAWAKEL